MSAGFEGAHIGESDSTSWARFEFQGNGEGKEAAAARAGRLLTFFFSTFISSSKVILGWVGQKQAGLCGPLVRFKSKRAQNKVADADCEDDQFIKLPYCVRPVDGQRSGCVRRRRRRWRASCEARKGHCDILSARGGQFLENNKL